MDLSTDDEKALRALPGTTGREFLADCPGEVAELFRYWEERRAGRRMPCRADIDPADFKRHLPNVLLVDVLGVDERGVGVFRYRVVGTGEVALRGNDPTGKLVAESFLGPSREEVIACYETVRRERRFFYDPHAFKTPEGRVHECCTIFLPLSEDGVNVSQILVYSKKRPRA